MKPFLKDPSPRTLYMRRWRERNRDGNRLYQRDYKQKRRRQVIDHYGGKCICCSEDSWEFLALDHKDGGGNAHRKEVRGRGNGMVDWIINNNYPDMFVIRCHNCNQARGFLWVTVRMNGGGDLRLQLIQLTG